MDPFLDPFLDLFGKASLTCAGPGRLSYLELARNPILRAQRNGSIAVPTRQGDSVDSTAVCAVESCPDAPTHQDARWQEFFCDAHKGEWDRRARKLAVALGMDPDAVETEL